MEVLIKTKQQIKQAKRNTTTNDESGNLRTKKNMNSKRKERTNRLLNVIAVEGPFWFSSLLSNTIENIFFNQHNGPALIDKTSEKRNVEYIVFVCIGVCVAMPFHIWFVHVLLPVLDSDGFWTWALH